MAAKVGLTLEEVLGDTPPEKLDQPCQDKNLCHIAREITNWVFLAPFLRVKAPEVEAIRGKWPFNVPAQNLELLRRWKQKHQRKGKDTYRNLCKAFMNAKEVTLVEKVCDVLCSQGNSSESSSDEDEEDVTHSPGPEPKREPLNPSLTTSGADSNPPTPTVAAPPSNPLEDLAEYLRMAYDCQKPDFAVIQWPPPPTFKVFNLAMIHSEEIIRCKPLDEALIRLTLRGSVDDIMKQKTSIQLKDLFKRDPGSKKRIVVLVEGAPGAGKSTLAWDICQKWNMRILFHQDFTIVIHVQLRDPDVQLAKVIADLIPMELDSERKDAASSLKACRGRGVLFVLDGWDEYSPGLQPGSLFDKLIRHPEKLSIPLSTVLITSRPIASGELQLYATSRVEIVGFTPNEVGRYFEDVFEDPVILQKLYDHLQERPTIKASCYLPLNAAIVAHLFIELNYTLPTTLHGLFCSLVLSCIIRHLTKESETQPAITSLDALPPDVQEVFEIICILAYKGTMGDKVTFSGQDLHLYDLPENLDTLSLMQAVQSFATGKPTSYHFLHLSIQELLTALHISKLPLPEQVQIFNELFGQPRFDAVFRFYAAFTKLQIEGMKDVVSRLVPSNVHDSHQKRRFLNLLHCLYEAQDASLCCFVSSQLKGSLNLSWVTLSPLDLLSLKYFLSCVNDTSTGPAAGCDSASRDAALATLDLMLCELTAEDVDSLSLHNLVTLNLGGNKLSCACAANLLASNPQLKEIRLSLTEDGVKVFATAIEQHPSLEAIDIFGNQDMVHGLPIIFHAIHNHHSLQSLRLSCYRSKDMEDIAAFLEVNESLREISLVIHSAVQTIDSDLVILATSLKKNTTLANLTLMFLSQPLPGSMEDFVWKLRDCQLKTLGVYTLQTTEERLRILSQQRDKVNGVLRDRGLPPLELKLR